MEYRIGCGGWAYFKVPGVDSLSAYSKAFDFAEVNSTFYSFPSDAEVLSWRRRVPDDFLFSVRCHRDLAYKYELRPCGESFEVLERMLGVCKTLRADVLHVQTPTSYTPDAPRTANLRVLLESLDLKGVRVALEMRGVHAPIPGEMINLMRDWGLIHCVDISKDNPVYQADVLYSRLFGRGRQNIYQFDDEELRQIDQRAKGGQAKKVILAFHSVTMYRDAARLVKFHREGRFPRITSSTGLLSLREVLQSDARFPATKHQVIERLGWKVFDMTDQRRIHTSEILSDLPEKKYMNLEELMTDLAKSFSK